MLVVQYKGVEKRRNMPHKHLFQILDQTSREVGIRDRAMFKSQTSPGMFLRFQANMHPHFQIQNNEAILYGWGGMQELDSRALKVPEGGLGCFLELVMSENTDANLTLGEMVVGLGKIRM